MSILLLQHVAGTFKTIPVTAQTTVSDVISAALEKFGLKGANEHDFFLTEVHLTQGVHERRMEHIDCPWKSLMDTRKKSVRKMKLTRFYLRQNLEPLGSVCNSVGSLPVGLEPSKCKTLIGDILGETMEYCEMKSVFPSYGELLDSKVQCMNLFTQDLVLLKFITPPLILA
ncbi:diacylglycerol kinase theta-like [Stylophora pistillata]|uniref:diacylglycerol kinase theta-like n=1 Tax=Stylophora pistillata TaxID=50429 RepID=UPI000C050BC2|nr:diacylglycerol kinase theta-like [Stylophora pistillata]